MIIAQHRIDHFSRVEYPRANCTTLTPRCHLLGRTVPAITHCTCRCKYPGVGDGFRRGTCVERPFRGRPQMIAGRPSGTVEFRLEDPCLHCSPATPHPISK